MYVLFIFEYHGGKHADDRLCGGLTVYAPMIRNGAGPGKKIGVVGLGGL
jgi:alcohol dehydrogenase (NADP+)